MGKDYKIGLICGLVAAVAVVIWLATRPSLNPSARMFGPASAPPQKVQPGPSVADLIDQSNQNSRGRQPQGAGTPQLKPPESQRTETPRVAEQTPAAPRQPETIAPSRTHVVRSGESLSSISQQYYGTPDAWQRIFKANAGTIKDASKIPLGATLIIP